MEPTETTVVPFNQTTSTTLKVTITTIDPTNSATNSTLDTTSSEPSTSSTEQTTDLPTDSTEQTTDPPVDSTTEETTEDPTTGNTLSIIFFLCKRTTLGFRVYVLVFLNVYSVIHFFQFKYYLTIFT